VRARAKGKYARALVAKERPNVRAGGREREREEREREGEGGEEES